MQLAEKLYWKELNLSCRVLPCRVMSCRVEGLRKMCNSLLDRKGRRLIFLKRLINFDSRFIENLCLEEDNRA
jgi:hypothetical protein